MMRKKLILLSMSVLLCFFSARQAKAFFVFKLVSLLLKPVTIPLGFIGKKSAQAVGGTAKLGVKTAKAGLSNISISSGPVKVRPFDFKKI